MNIRRKHVGWLLLAAVSMLAFAVSASVGDPSTHQLLSWDTVGAGLMLANAPLAITEQIKLFEAKLQATKDEAGTIIAKSVEEARTLDEIETQRHDELEAEVKSLTDHIARLKKHEQLMLTKATTVDVEKAGREAGGAGAGGGVEIRGGITSVRPNVEKGIAFTRFALAMVKAKGNVQSALAIASNTPSWKDTTPQVLNCLKFAAEQGDTKMLVEKAAVTAATTSHATWAGPLVQYQDMASEFIEYLRPMTILGKLNSLRRVPFNVRIARQTAGTTGGFVGEGLPKPVNAMAFDNITLGWFKAAVIVVLTDEVIRFSSPAIEALARQDMAEGIAQFLDVRFIDPTYSGVANVSPASITNGLTARQSTGITIAAITNDVKFMMSAFVNANMNLSTGVWVMSPVTALSLSMIRDTNDEFVFPDIGINGGTWFGLPVVTSNSVAAAGSPNEKQVILMDQKEVLLADDGEIAIDMSMEASLQMNDAPSAGATSLVSLWQNNMVGLRAERYINWRARRTGAVAILENLAL